MNTSVLIAILLDSIFLPLFLEDHQDYDECEYAFGCIDNLLFDFESDSTLDPQVQRERAVISEFEQLEHEQRMAYSRAHFAIPA